MAIQERVTNYSVAHLKNDIVQFCFDDPATIEIDTASETLSPHDALPMSLV